MKGKPKFKIGDKVRFWYWESFSDKKYGEELTDQNAKKIYKEGEIYIIDANGTFDDSSDVSYDIMVYNDKCKTHIKDENGNMVVGETIGDCLYKHFSERFVELI